MNMRTLICMFFVTGFSLIAPECRAQTISLHGSLASALIYSYDDGPAGYLGIRYTPRLMMRQKVNKSSIDGLLSVDLNSSATLTREHNEPVYESEADLYRCWLRYTAGQYEVRVGLQKINFGPGMLIRPLMWFDRLDPRDPLQMTQGVYGGLFRYYFLNNVNIWIWGLAGNRETKGWEVLPTERNSPEVGGRIEVPVARGEAGIAFNRRTVKVPEGYQALAHLAEVPLTESTIPETRFGADFRLDMGVGLWSELCAIHKEIPNTILEYQKMASIGLDYTFSAGNGIHVTGEAFYQALSSDFSGSDYSVSFYACSVTYPVSLVNTVSVMLFYDDTNSNLYNYFQVSAAFNTWEVFAIAFFTPDNMPLIQSGYSLFSGNGIELIVRYHH